MTENGNNKASKLFFEDAISNTFEYYTYLAFLVIFTLSCFFFVMN